MSQTPVESMLANCRLTLALFSLLTSLFSNIAVLQAKPVLDSPKAAAGKAGLHWEYYAHCESGHVDAWNGWYHREKAAVQKDADKHNIDHEKLTTTPRVAALPAA